MPQFRTSRKFDVLFLIILAIGLGVSYLYRTPIGDWVYFLHYQPTNQTTTAANDAGLNAAGLRLLERGNPQFAGQSDISTACGPNELGCTTPRGQIYVLDSGGQTDQAVVTAAHEMLHLAYRRLPQNKKDALAPLLDQAIAQNLIIGLQDELSNLTNIDDRRDEAHSLLGTEYKNLPPDLETYYQTYFTDRSKVLAAYARSEQSSLAR